MISVGSVFGYLEVIGEVSERKRGYVQWLCRCKCGKEKIVRSSHLRDGGTKSCGCYSRIGIGARSKKHGRSRTKEYSIWKEMTKRTSNPNNKRYGSYGGRGITVCERWKEFEAFYYDMGDCPEGMSIDRIDNEKGYSPGNCRWAPASVQSLNRGAPSNNKTGLTGVCRKRNGWFAYLHVNGVCVMRESHSSLLDAAAARKSAENRYKTPFLKNHRSCESGQ